MGPIIVYLYSSTFHFTRKLNLNIQKGNLTKFMEVTKTPERGKRVTKLNCILGTLWKLRKYALAFSWQKFREINVFYFKITLLHVFTNFLSESKFYVFHTVLYTFVYVCSYILYHLEYNSLQSISYTTHEMVFFLIHKFHCRKPVPVIISKTVP